MSGAKIHHNTSIHIEIAEHIDIVEPVIMLHALIYPYCLWKMTSNTQQQNNMGVFAGDGLKQPFEDVRSRVNVYTKKVWIG